MNIKVTTLVLICSLFSLTNSFAETQSKTIMFEDIDADADGSISKSEATFRKDLSKNFRSADTDNDGTISVDEYTAFHNKGRVDYEEVEIPEVGAAPVR